MLSEKIQLRLLSIEDLEFLPENPRNEIYDDALKDLAISLGRDGLIEPIVVRPHNQKFEVVAGERRVRAAIIANIPKIPAVVREGLTDKDASRLRLLENIKRKDLVLARALNLGFEGMRATPQVITSAMQLYFTGESFRNVQKFLKLQGVKVSHTAVFEWVKKYTALMSQYLAQIKPNVSDTWRADELYVKINGDMKYLFAMMDDETRFWIAQEVAESKDRHDARNLLKMSKELMGKKPLTFITDGLPAYHDAYKKEFRTLGLPQTKHVRHITLKGDRNNNKMERMNGEVRDREKVMRGLKKTDTATLKGYQLYHNFIRPHEALDGKTPSEACGIQIEGKNKWITLIQNASRKS